MERRTADLQDEARALRAQADAWEASRWGGARRAAEQAGPRMTLGEKVRAGRHIAQALKNDRREPSTPGVPPARAEDAAEPVSLHSVQETGSETLFPESDVTSRAATLAETVRSGRRLVVAAIMDPFTRLAFDPECDIVDLHPQTWEAELVAAQPDLLFVESAWRGHEDSWYDTVQTCPQELVDIVAWCRDRGISSVLWNKEDPVYFERYVKVAALVDHVFTTDLEVIPRYVHELGHHRVHVLPFAAQPSICNPVELGERKDAAVFAGSYYAGFKERNKALFAEIEGTSRVLPVEIFDRNFGTEEPTWQWPEPYRQLVVGTLPADQIDVAYKGYKVALNVNTVTTSQTMLARRAFDLLASGTPTVSNFSPSIKVLFGDLISASDSADEIENAVRQIVTDRDTTDKRRVMGVRHVMAQHTYRARFEHLIATVTGAELPRSAEVVGVVAYAADVDDLARWRDLVGAEQRRTLRLLVVSDDGAVSAACLQAGVAQLGVAEAATRPLAEALPGVVAVAGLHPDHWYGPHYLAGLLDALDYSPALAAAKTTRYRAADGAEELVDDGHEYRWWSGAGVSWHRAVARAEAVSGATVGDLVQGRSVAVEPQQILGVDRFDFGEGLADGERSHLGAQLPIQTGASVAALVRAEPVGTARSIPYDAYPGDLPASRPKRGFLARTTDQGVLVGWSYARGQHYLPFRRPIARDEFDEGVVHLKMEADAAGAIGINASWLDADGERIPGLTFKINEECRVEIPAEARALQLFLRVKGKGTALIRSVSIGARSWTSPVVLDGWSARTLVVANAYPSYRNLYQNGFVHSRVRGYRDRGVATDVFTLRDGPRHREFEGVQVLSGDEGMLRELLESGRYDRVLVHFLNRRMWDVLRDHAGSIPITVWVHGYEIQPWWRRTFDYHTEEELERGKEATAVRMELWREVSQMAPEVLKVVFVSEAFRQEVAEDQRSFGFGLDEAAVRIVHNPIDTSLFTYEPKKPEARAKILLIRPFVTKKYANDLAVEAIHELASEPWFDELTFRIIGDGPLFDELTAPLVLYPNVTVEKRFLSHPEIAALHKEYGVFLVPTRHDTQGVSRDEAMASGLVPITNDIPVIREFLSDAEGYLAPEDDAKGLADAIRDLYLHPETFLAKSQAAAARIRTTVASDVVIPEEIAIFGRNPARAEPTRSSSE